jgi:hypothetical protein
MLRKRALLSALVVGAVMIAMTLVSPGAAHADVAFIDYSDDNIRVSGQITVANDRTDWRLDAHMGWRPPDGVCIHLRMDIDRNNRPDKHFDSWTICQGGQEHFYNWRGDVTYSGTRGAQLNVVFDTGSYEIAYVKEGPIIPAH